MTLTSGVPYAFAFDSITNPLTPPIEIPVFEFTSSQSARIRVVDTGYAGDEFRFTIDGVPYFTSIPGPGPNDPINNFSSFDLAWADTALSRGTAYVGPGLHTIEITVVAESFNTRVSNDAIGYILAEEVPEPASSAAVAGGLAALLLLRRHRRARKPLRR